MSGIGGWSFGNQSAGLYGDVICVTVKARSLPGTRSSVGEASVGMPPGRSQSRGLVPGHRFDQSCGAAGAVVYPYAHSGKSGLRARKLLVWARAAAAIPRDRIINTT